MANLVQFHLTCANWDEARKITDALLEKKLVACVEQAEIHSKCQWDGKLEEADEIRLTMESVAENFDKVEAEVRKLHSYNTFVLQMVPVPKVSKDVEAWIAESSDGVEEQI